MDPKLPRHRPIEADPFADARYILTNKASDAEEVESILLGIEENVLVQSRKGGPSDIYLDHDETDPTTKAYFSANKIKLKPETMRYLDDVYGLLDGVRNGLGNAVLPLHLIKDDRDFEFIHPQKKLNVPVYLKFY